MMVIKDDQNNQKAKERKKDKISVVLKITRTWSKVNRIFKMWTAVNTEEGKNNDPSHIQAIQDPTDMGFFG